MTDLEFVGKMNPQRLRSWEEEFREEREQFYKDERDRELRRSGKLVEAEIELKYERDQMKKIRQAIESQLKELYEENLPLLRKGCFVIRFNNRDFDIIEEESH